MRSSRHRPAIRPDPSPSYSMSALSSWTTDSACLKTRMLVFEIRNREAICLRVVSGRPQSPVKSHKYHGLLIAKPLNSADTSLRRRNFKISLHARKYTCNLEISRVALLLCKYKYFYSNLQQILCVF